MRITVTVSRSAIVGGIDDERIDIDASLETYLAELEAQVQRSYPDAWVAVRDVDADGPVDRVDVWEAGDDVEVEDVQRTVAAIIEDVWESSTWLVAKWETWAAADGVEG